MKHLPIVFSSLALLGVLILGGMKLSEKKPRKKTVQKASESTTAELLASGAKVGFVDIDTLEANYDYFKKKKSEFETRQKNIDTELEKLAKSIQTEYEGLQRRAQAGTLSESEGEAAQQRLMQRQQDLESKRQNMGSSFLKDQEAFNKEIYDLLHAYIEKYNEEAGYDFILSYSKDGSILYANYDLDITRDIIQGMNDEKISSKTEKK
jgi:outer membrane protein